jgi:hypothetical protein
MPDALVSATIAARSTTAKETRLSGRWLALARVVWLSAAALLIASFLLTLPLTYAQLDQVCTGAACGGIRLRPQDLPTLAAWGLSPAVFAAYGTVLNGLALLTWIVMGVLLFARGSAEPRILFFSFCLVVFGGGPNQALAVVQPSWWLPVTAYGFLADTCTILLLFLFPTGQFVPRWTRWIVLAAILVTLPSRFFPDSPLSAATWPDAVKILGVLGVFGGSIVAQVYRYSRRSTPPERQQTKWVVLALGLFVLLLLTGEPVVDGAAPPLWVLLVYGTAFQLALLLIPLAIAASILRYRLWEIDSLINKALVYGPLTALLGAFYAGLILGLEALVSTLTGQTGAEPLVIVLSTLAIAALFLPVRRRIQQLIDRRFYRKKYDAVQTLAAFSATLRQEVDLEQVQQQLLALVQETMQPAQVSLWLRQPERQPTESSHRLEQRGQAPTNPSPD